MVFHVWLHSSPQGQLVGLGPLTAFVPDLAFGVTLFFVLSGFLLYRPFAEALLDRKPRPSIRGYLRNRALRILPAYWVILLAVAFGFQSALGPTSHNALRTGSMTDSGFLANASLLQNYRAQTVFTGIGPAWSLAVEAVFYLALPLFVVIAWSLAQRGAGSARLTCSALVPVAMLLAIGLSGKAVAAFAMPEYGPWAGWRHDWYSVLDKSFWCQADLFAFGCALAVLKARVDLGRTQLPSWWRPTAAASSLAGLFIAVHGTHDFGDRLGRSPYNTLMALACALLVALVVLPGNHGRRPPLLVRTLETRPLVGIGVISYSVFLWHQPLIFWLRNHGLTWAGRPGLAANLLLVCVITGVLSALTWRYVERLALSLKGRRLFRVPDAAKRRLELSLRHFSSSS